jgi:type IV pilus assembly protein PilW
MRQTSIAMQGLSALQDSERMSMAFLGANIQGAGYFPNPLTTTAATQFTAIAPFVAGQSITGTGNGSGYGVASPVGTDTLSVRFVTPLAGAIGAVIQGCSTGMPANTLYTDTFSIQTVNGKPVLACSENGGAAIPLVAGVQGMSVLYGVVDAATGGSSVTEYLAATAVTNWAVVKTVSITLQCTNPLAGQPGQAATVAFTRTIPYMDGL